jgi:hypothetical protein
VALVLIPRRFCQRAGIKIQAQWLHEVEHVVRAFSLLVSSGWRSEADNRAAGGAPNSDHLRGDAADFGGTSAQIARAHAWAQGRFPYVEPLGQSQDHLHISFRHGGHGGEQYGHGDKRFVILRYSAAVDAIYRDCAALHLDPVAVAAVAYQEGASGKIGDHGASYGPWQLYIGGALPRRWARLGKNSAKTQAWAWSAPGIRYALSTMAGAGAAGKHGHEAIRAIVDDFEKPKDKPFERKWAGVQYDWLKRQPHGPRRAMVPWFIGPVARGGVIPPQPPDVPPVTARAPGQAWAALMHELGHNAPAKAHRVQDIARRLRRGVH